MTLPLRSEVPVNPFRTAADMGQFQNVAAACAPTLFFPGNPMQRFGFTGTGGFPSVVPRGILVHSPFRFIGSSCHVGPSEVLDTMSLEVERLLNSARCAAHRGLGVAKVFSKLAFVAVALLIVTVGVLSTESRLPTAGHTSASWHTSKTSRMTIGGGSELAPVQQDEARPAAPIVTPELTRYSPPIDLPLPEIAGALQAHGLRAPPLA